MIYMLDGDTLFISGDLIEVVLDMAFEVKIARLLHGYFSDITLDLRLAKSITSPYIGQINACAERAKERGKKLRVIATGKVTELLQVAGVDKMLQLEMQQAGSRHE